MTPCQLKVINCTYFAVFAVSLRPFQGLIHADMDLDIKAKKNSHYVVLQLEIWYANMKSLLID